MTHLTEQGIENVRDAIESITSIRPNRKFVLDREQKFSEWIDDFYGEANDGGIGDTCVSGMLADVLAIEFTKFNHWPTYGQGILHMEEFRKKFKPAFEKAVEESRDNR